MPRRLKKRSRKAGLPPGSLIHIGDRLTEKTKITAFDYDESHLQEKEIKTVGECQQFKDSRDVSWIHVEGIHETQILEELGALFGLHPLTLEDILNTEQRPKVEDYGVDLFIVVKLLSYNEKTDEIEAEQISLILRRNALLSFQEKEGDDFLSVKGRIQNGKGRLRRLGADYLAYALIDAIVDSYFSVLEDLGERIVNLEEDLARTPDRTTLFEINGIKKEIIYLRKAVWPLREAVSFLERGDSSLLTPATRVYFRDVYDHTVQVIDTVETYRDLLSGMLDLYLSSISNRTNEIMKFLTVIGTIFIPLTFLAGVYGMNFHYFPELDKAWAYPAFWAVCVVLSVTMLLFFRRRGWL